MTADFEGTGGEAVAWIAARFTPDEQAARLGEWLDARPASGLGWDEAAESQMDYAALTFDEETGKSARLAPRKPWHR